MELLELKKQIHDAIDLEDDEERLLDYFRFIKTESFWDSLSISDKNELVYLAENKDKLKWIDHETVKESHKKWLSK
jgi:hypothetical protein